MEASASDMMIREVPIYLRMQLKALAAMQHGRLRDIAIEALREKAEKESKNGTNELNLPDQVESHL